MVVEYHSTYNSWQALNDRYDRMDFPCLSPMNSGLQEMPIWIKIWQQNRNKSRVAQEDLINSQLHKSYDILMLQEPYIDGYGNTKAMQYWRVVYPMSHLVETSPLRAVILVNKH